MMRFWPSKKAAIVGAVRVPAVGDPLWWCTKREKCVVTEVHPDGSFNFSGGPVIKNKRGRQVPRWSVAAKFYTDQELRALSEQRGVSYAKLKRAATHWHERGFWVVGTGPTPKYGRGQLIYPKPVLMSGRAQGSFAVEA